MTQKGSPREIAGHAVAKPIVPTAQQSGPLTPIDLANSCTHPVYAEDIELISAGQAYLMAIRGEETKILPPLRDAVQLAENGTLRRDIRILIDYDTNVHITLGFPKFEKYYEHLTGQKIGRSTVWRRRLRAEFALILGARNRPDLLPSQRQCELIRKQLTRDHGISFLLGFESSTHLHRMGEARLLEQISTYQIRHNLPNVGERVDLVDEAGANSPAIHEAADDDLEFMRKVVEILSESSSATFSKPHTAAARVFVAMEAITAQPTIQVSEEVGRIVNLILRDRREVIEELVWVTLANLVTTALFANNALSPVSHEKQIAPS